MNSFHDFARKAELERFPTTVTRDTVFDGKIIYGYVVEDIKFAKEYMKKHPELHVYTLVSGDNGKSYIVDGCRTVNREGYLFGRKLIQNIELEF